MLKLEEIERRLRLYNNVRIHFMVSPDIVASYQDKNVVIGVTHLTPYQNKLKKYVFSTASTDNPVNLEIGDYYDYSVEIKSNTQRATYRGPWDAYLSFEESAEAPFTCKIPWAFMFVDPTLSSESSTDIYIYLTEINGEIYIDVKKFTLDESLLDGKDLLV